MGKQRDQAIRDIVKGAGIVYAGLVIEVVIAFLAQVIAARFLSASSFGGITTGTALVNIGAIIAGLGFGPGLTRYLPRLDAGEKAAVTRFAYLLTVPFSVVLGALVSLNATFIASRVFDDPAVAESIRVFGAAIPFAAVLGLAIGGIRAGWRGSAVRTRGGGCRLRVRDPLRRRRGACDRPAVSVAVGLGPRAYARQ
jgi:O-antigen/teichoic acid export membrane protein